MTQQTIYELVCLTTFETINHNNVRSFIQFIFFLLFFLLLFLYVQFTQRRGRGWWRPHNSHGKREAYETWNSEQQWATTNAEHQCWLSKLAIAPAAPWRRKIEQGKCRHNHRLSTTIYNKYIWKKFIYPLEWTAYRSLRTILNSHTVLLWETIKSSDTDERWRAWKNGNTTTKNIK